MRLSRGLSCRWSTCFSVTAVKDERRGRGDGDPMENDERRPMGDGCVEPAVDDMANPNTGGWTTPTASEKSTEELGEKAKSILNGTLACGRCWTPHMTA